jgi:hypothetical protein
MVRISYDLQDQVEVYMDSLQEVSKDLSEFCFPSSSRDQSESSSFLLKFKRPCRTRRFGCEDTSAQLGGMVGQ